jgi:cysteine desulfurase
VTYLDYNATTPVAEEVLSRMMPFMREHFGNPSSKGHAFGWAAEEATNIAREEICSLLGADPEGLVFTGGATEAINLALKGTISESTAGQPHVITVATEHSAVLETVRALGRRGVRVTILPVESSGLLDLQRLEEALSPETRLVAVMWANNETGILQPIREIAELIRPRGVLMMTDATQAVGKVPVSVEHIDFLACSGHKFYAPKGVGALWVRSGQLETRLAPLIHGGGQEHGKRAGTLNVPGIVGMGAAAAMAAHSMIDEAARQKKLRDRMETVLMEAIPGAMVNGAAVPRLPQTSSIVLRGARAANMISRVRGFAFSAGSACSSGTGKPSHVLKALGLSDADCLSTVRLSLGRPTTAADVESAVASILEAYRQEARRSAVPA